MNPTIAIRQPKSQGYCFKSYRQCDVLFLEWYYLGETMLRLSRFETRRSLFRLAYGMEVFLTPGSPVKAQTAAPPRPS